MDTEIKRRMGFALCGSFCTFSRVIETVAALAASGWSVTPIMSFHSAATDKMCIRDSFQTVYPAAGSADSAVRLSLDELEQCSSGFAAWIDVCKDCLLYTSRCV